MWYGFFTAVVSFRRMVLANRFYRTGSPPPLILQLRSGHPHRYFDFPQDEYREFLNAESHGRYFLDHIRERFRYERMAKLRTA
jgi:hypothetical protein